MCSVTDSAIDETDAYDLPEGEKHPYEEFASRFWEEVACRYWAAKDEVKKDMEEKRKQWKRGRLAKCSRRKKTGKSLRLPKVLPAPPTPPPPSPKGYFPHLPVSPQPAAAWCMG